MRLSVNGGFVTKVAGALALTALADRLFWAKGFGSNLGLFAMVWTIATLVLVPAVRRDRRALAALALALALGLVLGDDPSWLAWLSFCVTLGVAALLPRVGRFGAATRWSYRLLVHALAGLIAPWRDLARARRLHRRRGSRGSWRRVLPLLPLPVLGGAVFVALFATANPLIGDALARVALPGFDFESIVRALFLAGVGTMVWATLRPARINLKPSVPADSPHVRLPGVSVGSVTLSLIAFNALFAVQNGLDLAFLWSGAALPDGTTLAGYAHRGAYPLIATALLAGLFVLVTLRPGSDTAAVPLIRRMVVLWVLQNVLLVASSILRTLDYVDAYSLTRLRIAALAWMGLVAVGLLLILWRLLAARSATWLINANTAAAGVVLIAASVVDLGSVAASWNVRHAREVGGHGAALDLCYLGGLGPSSLVSLTELATRRGLEPAFAERVARVRETVFYQTVDINDGEAWTWSNERRLERATLLQLAPPRLPVTPQGSAYGYACDGRVVAPDTPDPAYPMPEVAPPPPPARLPAPPPPPAPPTPGTLTPGHRR